MNEPIPKSEKPWGRSEFAALEAFLLEERGFSFKAYRESYISRRISSCLNRAGCNSLKDYLALLKRDPNELNTLYNALTINFSCFYRNKEVFDFLKHSIFPALIRRKTEAGTKTLNILSYGCSSGEEPYSIALLLTRSLGIKLKDFKILIKAVDIDEKMLEAAKEGIYPPDKLAALDKRILRSCFDHVGEAYQIQGRFREMVDFERRNIIDLQPFDTLFDVILCRNMLIYFNKEKHLKTYDYFFRNLVPEGYLVLGKAEVMISPSESNFDYVSAENRVYRKAMR